MALKVEEITIEYDLSVKKPTCLQPFVQIILSYSTTSDQLYLLISVTTFLVNLAIHVFPVLKWSFSIDKNPDVTSFPNLLQYLFELLIPYLAVEIKHGKTPSYTSFNISQSLNSLFLYLTSNITHDWLFVLTNRHSNTRLLVEVGRTVELLHVFPLS